MGFGAGSRNSKQRRIAHASSLRSCYALLVAWQMMHAPLDAHQNLWSTVPHGDDIPSEAPMCHKLSSLLLMLRCLVDPGIRPVGLAKVTRQIEVTHLPKRGTGTEVLALQSMMRYCMPICIPAPSGYRCL
eukprot:3419293-Amphidinium_carterae.1